MVYPRRDEKGYWHFFKNLSQLSCGTLHRPGTWNHEIFGLEAIGYLQKNVCKCYILLTMAEITNFCPKIILSLEEGATQFDKNGHFLIES